MSFILNGLLFTLVGLQLPSVVRGLGEVAFTDALGLGLIVALAAILVRFIWVFPTTYLKHLLRRKPVPEDASSWPDVTIVSWAGMRGAVSLAAALALPAQLGGHPFAQRDLFVFVTFCVIVVTLIGQGLTLPLVTRALGVVASQDGSHEEMHARAAVAEAALALLPGMRTRWPGHAELVDRLQAEYEHRVLHAEEHRDSEIGAADRETLEHRQMRQELIDAERAAAREMHGRAAISDEVYRRLIRDLDLDELRSA
jgi:CPA1 family monovalent cation:H+ antiporter